MVSNPSISVLSSTLEINATAPSAFTLSANTTFSNNGAFTLTWTAATNAGSYTIIQNNSILMTGLTNNSISFSGQANGIFNFMINATDHFGNTSSNVVPVTVQVPPQTFTLNPITSPNNNGSITLNWTSAPYATSYTIFVNSIGNVSGLIITSYSYANLIDGTYNFNIEALNSYGSVNSSSIIVIVENFPISCVLSANETISNDGTLMLNWTSSTFADNYSIYQNSTFLVSGLTNNSYFISGLTNNSYTYTVVAFNTYGNATSNAVAVIVQRIPVAFTLSANPLTSTNGTIALSWTQSQFAVNYTIYANISLIASGLTSLSYTLNGVTDGTYNYSIETFNVYGNITSTTVTVIVQNYPQTFTLLPVPSPNHSGSFTLSWPPRCMMLRIPYIKIQASLHLV